MSIKNWVISGLITSGIGSGLLGTSHYATKRTILDDFGNNVLRGEKEGESEFDEEWKLLKAKLNKLEDTKLKKDELFEIKNSSDEKSLKKICESKYEETYFNIFTSSNNKTKEFVENYCTYKISEKLGENKLIEEGDANDKLNQLKQDKEENELKNIKDSKDLVNWCKSNSDKGYQGEEKNNWKLINKYCVKNQ